MKHKKGEFSLVEINKENIILVKNFIDTAGTSLLTFRYFAKRPVEIVEKHMCTLVYVDTSNKGEVVCYGHLDKENETVWLGIAVSHNYNRRGIGTMMMEELIKKADEQKVPRITLSVDENNFPAIQLYTKFGFVEKEIKLRIKIFELSISSINGIR